MPVNATMIIKISAFIALAFATIVRTFTSSESFCVQQDLSFHPNPPINSHLCVNTTSPCQSLEPGIKYCKKGATGLWRLVRCNAGFELHVVKIKKSGADYASSTDTPSNDTTWTSMNETKAEHGVQTMGEHLQLIGDMEVDSEIEGSEYYWGSCHDINECERGEEVHSCSHLCQNLPGSFRCRCPVGFALAKDGRTCLSIAKNFASVVGMLFGQTVDYISDHQL